MEEHIFSWDSAYRHRPYRESLPEPEVVEFALSLHPAGPAPLLDLGCGDGRHLLYLARQGHTAFGLDRSLEGVQRTRESLTRHRLPATAVCGDMVRIPWPDGTFRAVIATQVIHHNPLALIRQTFAEIHRVLRTDGWLLATIASYPPGDWKNGKTLEIEPHTFVPTEPGFEQGVPHHFFTADELRSELSAFAQVEIDRTERHLRVLALKGKTPCRS